VVWNVNGISDSKNELHGILDYLNTFDIVMLVETRLESIDREFLVDFSIAHIPASKSGKAGQGILLGVKKARHYHVLDWTSDDTSLWVKVIFGQGARPLFVGCTYIPPSGSPLLTGISAEQRFENLQLQILAATEMGDVICGGDFNARIGDRGNDTGLGRLSRGCTDTGVNAFGTKLLELCRLSDCLLCTGIVGGDEGATPTYRATVRSRATRPDHVIVSKAHAFGECLYNSRVNVEQRGSDHLPIECHMRLRVPMITTVCEGTLLKQLRWKPTQRGIFVGSLTNDMQVYSQRCEESLINGNVGQAIDTIEEWVRQAAKVAGMAPRTKGKGPTVVHKPFFDRECLDAKHHIRAMVRRYGYTNETKELERQYHALVRRKKRDYMAQQVRSVTKLRWEDPRAFWKTFKGKQGEVPGPLAQVQHWDSFIQQLASRNQANDGGIPLSHEIYPQLEIGEGHEKLDVDISIEDVDYGLRQLNSGRTPGFKGYPAEFLSCSRRLPTKEDLSPKSVLVEPMKSILNAMFTRGQVPHGANVHLVTPVLKKGDELCIGNYRPIAVPEPLMRLYATILNNRLVEYLEGNGCRAQTQTGFRPGFSTVHQLFALQHFVDGASRRKPLYCCFLDLSKAYDRVPQHQVWEALARLGVKNRLIAAISSIYQTAEVAMKIGDRVGTRHEYLQGLLQGCPLSPTLFGVFSDGLHRHLEKYCPEAGVPLHCGTRVKITGFADDFAVFAQSKEHLQQLLDESAAWCRQVGMEIGCPKTKVMVFKGDEASREPVWKCEGIVLEVVPTYKYLGIVFDQDHGIHGTYTSSVKRIWAAWASVLKKYGNLKCPSAVGLLLDLYQACVPPAGTYGCEIWGCREVSPVRFKKERENIIKVQLQILRRICGIRKQVCEDILLRELDMQPIEIGWWKRTINFYNSVRSLPANNIYHKIAFEDYHLSMGGNKKTLLQSLISGLNAKGYAIVVHGDRLPPIDLEIALDILSSNANRVWQGLSNNPRTCPSQGAQLCTYKRWMAIPDPVTRRRKVLHVHLDASKVRKFLRFRTLCHNLPIDRGRQSRPSIPRLSRICEHCTSGEIGDEMHMIFECMAVQNIRDRYAHLFTYSTSTMSTFLWQDDIVSVIKFVIACLDILGQT